MPTNGPVYHMNRTLEPGVTQLLAAWRNGDAAAVEQLIPLIYGELKRLARSQLAGERSLTLQATALVHEAYLKLVDQRSAKWQNRVHFFAIAARLMRRIVIKRARRRDAAKRGGGAEPLCVDLIEVPAHETPVDLLALDEALTRLTRFDSRQAEIVELRFFGGLSVEEIAEVLGISSGTVKREWRTAKAWLHKEVSGGREHDS